MTVSLRFSLAPCHPGRVELSFDGDRSRFRAALEGAELEEVSPVPPMRRFRLPDGQILEVNWSRFFPRLHVDGEPVDASPDSARSMYLRAMMTTVTLGLVHGVIGVSLAIRDGEWLRPQLVAAAIVLACAYPVRRGVVMALSTVMTLTVADLALRSAARFSGEPISWALAAFDLYCLWRVFVALYASFRSRCP